MKRRCAALAAASCLSLCAHVAEACPCQGSSGPGASVTTAADVFGASLTETTRFVPGAWRANGDYAPLAPGYQQSAEDVTAIAGYRPMPLLELSVEAAVGRESFTSPDFHSARTAFGDTTVRARWDAIDEPMPYQHPRIPWPAVSFIASLRMPTSPSGRGEASSVFSGTTGSVGSSSTSEGLGAWEPSIGVAALRSFDEHWQVSAYVEGAFRFPDSYLGLERHLGPRALAQLGARYAPTNTTGVGLTTDYGWEAPVSYPGTPGDTSNTSQRIWTVGAFCYLRAEPSRLRWGAMVRYAPPIDGVGKNASQSTSVAVSLGYVFL